MIHSNLVLLPTRRELLSVHELPKLLDEAISEEEQLDMDLASAVCQRFLEWDLETQEASFGEVRAKLVQVLGRDVDRTDEE
jgi:DNA mismatch repair protein MSH5